jgi:thiamine-phosphate pyrophosphorylase
LCRQARVPLIIDDRADIALLLHAGLHVGQDDLPPRDARGLIGAEAVLGYSTHNREQLAAAAQEPVSYLAIGPVFATQSKVNPDPVVGVLRLREWRRLTDKPLVAIGGITRENARSVLDAGADSVAVIGDLLPPDCAAGAIRKRFEQWQEKILKTGGPNS